jgi:phosphate transport system permease protein
VTTPSIGAATGAPVRRVLNPTPTRADRIFRTGVSAAAVFTLTLLGLIGLFLVLRSAPALHRAGFHFLTRTQWTPEVNDFGVLALVTGTITIALIAMIVAIPVGFCASLYISEYAPRPVKRILVTVVDLMAAVPNIIWGLWGLEFAQPHLLGTSRWIATHFGSFLPFLKVSNPESPSSFTSSAFIAGIVVGIMVVPTATSVMREVFSQAPIGEREGAIALGATKWGMIRKVVIPFGRSGIIGGSMLGLGRALGETIAVYLIITPILSVSTHPLQSGSNSIAAWIATRYSESSGIDIAALMAAGLVLFAMTVIVDTAAGVIVSKSRSGASTE